MFGQCPIENNETDFTGAVRSLNPEIIVKTGKLFTFRY